ncbi:uncharacterized protein LOC143259720 [Megalopta genalis]|uniref:uncharacterized protein LOC143259720 n=1 Tax=Megalopta genalis TaxID=115081 RepID=UPI003FD16F11
MDRFLGIDWNQPLEDIIDNTFIHDERLERESVTYRIMNGNFIDPYKDMEDDYEEIKIDLMEDVKEKIKVEDKSDGKMDKNKKVHLKETKRSKNYVPGILKPLFGYPRSSRLNKEQQALCLKVLLRFSESNKPRLTQAERQELQKYMDLQKLISQEQNEFLEFAKSKWKERSATLRVQYEDYIDMCWQSKLQYIHKLPRYYTEVTNIPFVSDKNIEVKFDSVCLQMGELPQITLPSLTSPYYLAVNSEKLRKRFPHKNRVCKKSALSYKLPVSEDVNCQKLAEDSNADIVISSSGLNCLVNNIGPNYSNSWILPIVIKRHNDKNVIYVDKPGPPSANTVPGKNNWVYKYILKYFLIPAQSSTTDNKESNDNDITNEDDDMFGNLNSEEILKLEEENDSVISHTGDNVHLKLVRENENVEKSVIQDSEIKTNIPTVVNVCSGIATNDIKHPNTTNTATTQVKDEPTNSEVIKDNVSYKLFTIGPESSERNNLMKNVGQEYKMLVRTKTDGFEILSDNEQKLLVLAPKLEYQSDFGAESVTLGEATKQWVSLKFRPHTFLARVRISAGTSEVLQVEQRTAISINNEIKRLYNIKVEDSLAVLHNVIELLSGLSPGRYVMRHTIRQGPFAVLYKEADSTKNNTFDLHTIYNENFQTLPYPPWIPMDKIVPSPMHKVFGRMPAMFYPSNKPSPKNTKLRKPMSNNSGTVRRSLRTRKTKNFD